MPESNQNEPNVFRDVLLRWTHMHTWGAVVALLSVSIVAALQIGLLSAWRTGVAEKKIPIAPVNAAVTAGPKGRDALVYNFVGMPAVSTTPTISLNTDQVLGVSLGFDHIPEQTTLTLGWVGTHDRRKPSNLAIPLAPSEDAKKIYVPLRGHSEWRDTATQFAVMLVSRNGTESVVLSNVEFVGATPVSAINHAIKRWSGSSDFATAPVIAERVLPLSALTALAALIAFGFVAWRHKDDRESRRDATLGALAIFAVATLELTLFRGSAFSINNASGPWLFSAVSIVFALSPRYIVLSKNFAQLFPLEIASLLFASASVWLGGWPFAWALLAVVVIHLARKFPNAFLRARAVLFFAPLLALGAFTQARAAKHIEFTNTALRDPSPLLANLIQQSGAIAGILGVFFFAYLSQHRSLRAERDDCLGIALWFAALGSIACLIVLPADRILELSTGAVWILLPLVVATIGWLMPSFLAPIASTKSIAVENNKTEHDLSDVVRQLFDGAAASFDAAINSQRPSSALAPLNRMKEIAPGSTITRIAELTYALHSTNLNQARAAYNAIKRLPPNELDDDAKWIVLAYANRIHDFDTVIARASTLPPTEESLRLLARARVLAAAPENVESARMAALEMLQSCPKPNKLAHEIAELHLLARDWEAAKSALADSSIALDSPSGKAYIARLGFIATNGHASYVEQIQKLVTWSSQLAVAQAAMGEVLLGEGNLVGARARFKLAKDGDITLWAMERRMKDIDAALAAPIAERQIEKNLTLRNA